MRFLFHAADLVAVWGIWSNKLYRGEGAEKRLQLMLQLGCNLQLSALRQAKKKREKKWKKKEKKKKFDTDKVSGAEYDENNVSTEMTDGGCA